jgi:hypothetical protein
MTRYASLDDLTFDLDHEGFLGDDDGLSALDDEDLALLGRPQKKPAATPAPKKRAPRKKKAPA